MIDPRRSAAARKAAATRRRRKAHPTAEALDAAVMACERLFRAAKAEGFIADADMIREALLDVGAQIDQRNGY